MDDIKPSYSNDMAAVMMVAKRYQISPREIWEEWTIPFFLDVYEGCMVENEIETRKAEAIEAQQN